MSDTFMSIVGIVLAVVLLFIFPLMEFAGKNDEIAQTVAQTAVSDFVTTVTSTGEITEFEYNKLIQKLYSTGNSYDIQIEAQILDDNPRRATVTSSEDLMGDLKYYSVYTNTILASVQSEEQGNKYTLKKDDYLVVTAKNTNITIGTQFKNLLYKLIGKETYTIGVSASGSVLNVSQDNKKIAINYNPPKPVIPTPTPTATPTTPTPTTTPTTIHKQIYVTNASIAGLTNQMFWRTSFDLQHPDNFDTNSTWENVIGDIAQSVSNWIYLNASGEVMVHVKWSNSGRLIDRNYYVVYNGTRCHASDKVFLEFDNYAEYGAEPEDSSFDY